LKPFTIHHSPFTILEAIHHSPLIKPFLKPFTTVLLTGLLMGFVLKTQAQSKQAFTLDNLHQGLFRAETVEAFNWMKDSRYYTALTGGSLVRYQVGNSQKPLDTLISVRQLVLSGQTQPLGIVDYEFSQDESQVLLLTEREGIYRHSFRAFYYVFDRNTQQIRKLSQGGKQSYASFSSDGKKVAFVRDNNLFNVDLSDMSEKAITSDGQANQRINGSTDWVYEEEFSFTKAFFWSPQGNRLAWYVFDESQVPEYKLQRWGKLYPEDYRFKYPKAGQANSIVNLSVYDFQTGLTTQLKLDNEPDTYLPRVQWTTDNDLLSVKRMNRLQNKLEILHVQVVRNAYTIAFSETSSSYVDVEFTDDLTYLPSGQGFIQSSERNGFRHLYHFDMQGKPLRQITSGNWEVSTFHGIDLDAKTPVLYFTSTENGPLERQLYRIQLNGKGKQQLSTEKGSHNISFSTDYRYFIDTWSSANTPPVIRLHQSDGKLVKTLVDNEALRKKLETYAIGEKEFIKVPVGSETLNGYLIKPVGFDPSKKYPVLVHVYGGQGSQQVLDQYASPNWMHVLVQQGYLIACVDNRGTGARGKAFRTITYANLGKYEVEDQIAAARYVGSLPYVDAKRIGINGWSYGGYMSALCLTVGADVFKAGIVGAPVTTWRLYDSIYTERYMKTPQLNAEGYDQYAPLLLADKLKGKMLLIHGTGDDNVHFQHSIQFVDALIKAGKQFEVFYYPNQPHGIRGYYRQHMDRLMLNFLLREL
jgi:dipeptidyl-peptidase-4